MPTVWEYKGRGHSLYSVSAIAGGYAIFDRSGARIGEPFRFRGEAERRRDELQGEADRKAKRGPRSCLCCGVTFASEGIHNRLCPRCRARSEGDQSQRPTITKRKSA